MIQILKENQILLLFVVSALGYWLGSIRILGTRLGVAAVLFVGLAFGALDPGLQVPKIFIFLGLAIYVYTIGLSSGPGFLATFRRRGAKDILFVLSMLALSALATIGFHYLFSFKASLSAGMFAGVTTNTPALAGLLDLIQHTAGAKELGSAAIASFSSNTTSSATLLLSSVELSGNTNSSRSPRDLHRLAGVFGHGSLFEESDDLTLPLSIFHNGQITLHNLGERPRYHKRMLQHHTEFSRCVFPCDVTSPHPCFSLVDGLFAENRLCCFLESCTFFRLGCLCVGWEKRQASSHEAQSEIDCGSEYFDHECVLPCFGFVIA